jgi:hypothetical protein
VLASGPALPAKGTGLRINGGMTAESAEDEQNDEDNHQQPQDSSKAASPVISLAMAIEAATAK